MATCALMMASQNKERLKGENMEVKGNLNYWVECGKYWQEKVDAGEKGAINHLDHCIKHIGFILNLDFVNAEIWLLNNI